MYSDWTASCSQDSCQVLRNMVGIQPVTFRSCTCFEHMRDDFATQLFDPFDQPIHLVDLVNEQSSPQTRNRKASRIAEPHRSPTKQRLKGSNKTNKHTAKGAFFPPKTKT